ncbi:MAG: hypothetical protein H7175_22095 [Burkholderiales bacterium]|nr:hypothetical protein [Anaerolineae bacterium]
METLKVRAHVGGDGILKLEVPVGLSDVDYEVTITLRPEMTREQWQAYVEETYGSLADDPIERGEQPPFEVRDEIE